MKIRESFIIAVLFVRVFLNTAAAQDYAPPVSYPAGKEPTALTLGDFNSHGNVDVVAAKRGEASLSFFAGDGSGSFKPAVNIPLTSPAVSVTAADVNGDSKLDLAVAFSDSAVVEVLLGNGDGTFQSPIAILVPNAQTTIIREIAIIDLNGDGHTDLLAATSAGLYIFLNDAHGQFSTATFVVGNGLDVTSFVVADFNKDGHPDIAWIGAGSPQCGIPPASVFVSYGNGNATFREPRALPITNFTPAGIAAGDFNQDGRLDLVVSQKRTNICPPDQSSPGTLQVALQQADGTFVLGASLTGTEDPGAVITGDFDGDGNLDMATLQSSLNSSDSPSPAGLVVYRGKGNGEFSAPNQFALPANPYALVAGTFANTVALDLAVVEDSANELSVLVNQGASQVTLVSSNNPAKLHQPVTLTATIQPRFAGNGPPPGTVIFADGDTTLGTAPVDASGVATLTATFRVQGKHSLTAVYGGGGDFVGGPSSKLKEIVNGPPPDVFMQGSPNPSAFGQTVKFTVDVFLPPSGPVPSGTVNLTEGGKVIATGVLDSTGQVKLQVNTLPVGSHTVVAQYLGDSTFGPASSSPLTQVVNGSPSATTVNLTPNPSVFGQPVTLTAGVVSANGFGIPSGTVVFVDGGTNIGTATLDSSGNATLQLNSFNVGNHSIVANYSGDSNFQASTSAPASQVVSVSPTTTSLTTAPNPSVFGEAVTLTSSVVASGGGAGIPTGTITFNEGTTTFGSAPLDNTGKASLTVSSLTAGNHNITASYGGDTSFQTSTASAPQTVNTSPTATTLTAAPNPSIFGENVTLSITVAAAGGGVGTPSGNVTVLDDGTAIGTAPLDNSGKAALTISTLNVGTHHLSAAYAGDQNFNPSSTSARGGVNQVVNQSSTITTISSSSEPSVFGQTVTFTAVVAASNGGAGVPSGTVAFSDGATVIGSEALDNTGKAALTTSSLAVGSHSLTASYRGNPNFLASNSAPLSQFVNKNSVMMSLFSTPNPSTYRESVSFTLQVSPDQLGGGPGTPLPTGTVTLTEGANVLGTSPLDNLGKAAFVISNLPAGSHSIGAAYSGDENFSNSILSGHPQEVDKAPTQTTLTSSLNPATNASTVLLSAHVSSTVGPLSGNVTFLDGTSVLASVPLDSSGSATLPLSHLSVGSHALSAAYAGDTNFADSQSPAVSEKIVDSHSSVVLTSSVNPQTVTKEVTFVASVTSALGGTATGGTITFSDGPTTLATVPLANSAASFTTTALAVGDHNIVAAYQASTAPGPFDGMSPVLIETIKPASPIVIIGGNKQDFTISIEQPSADLFSGQTFNTQMTLAPVNGFTGKIQTICAGAPTGSTCTVAPDTATLDGKNPVTATITISITAVNSTASLLGTGHRGSGFAVLLTLGFLPFAIGISMLPIEPRRRRRLFILALLPCLFAGCGGTRFVTRSLSTNTPPGSYVLTVQSQSGPLAHSSPIRLAVK